MKSWQGIIIAIASILLLINGLIIPIMQSGVVTSAVGAATGYLEDRGYAVFTPAQYALLAKEATAYAAVQNATAAVVAAQAAAALAGLAAEKVDLFNTADTFLFPSSTTYYVLLCLNRVQIFL